MIRAKWHPFVDSDEWREGTVIVDRRPITGENVVRVCRDMDSVIVDLPADCVMILNKNTTTGNDWEWLA